MTKFEIKVNDIFTVKKFNGGEKQVAVISLNPFMVQDVETNEQYLAKLRIDGGGAGYHYMSVYVGKDIYTAHLNDYILPSIHYKEYQYSDENVVRNHSSIWMVYPNSEERDKDYNALVRGEIIKQEANLSTNYKIDIDTKIDCVCVKEYIKFSSSDIKVLAERTIKKYR